MYDTLALVVLTWFTLLVAAVFAILQPRSWYWEQLGFKALYTLIGSAAFVGLGALWLVVLTELGWL